MASTRLAFTVHNPVRAQTPRALRRRTGKVCLNRVRSTSEEKSLFEGGDDVPELNEEGELIDTKTGKALNEFGATRFDVAVRALRGEYDPPGVSTENEQGQLYDTITQFPCEYTFQAAGKSAELTESAIAEIKHQIGQICGCNITPSQLKIKERGSSGKFISVWVTCTVHSSNMVQEVLRELKVKKEIMMIC